MRRATRELIDFSDDNPALKNVATMIQLKNHVLLFYLDSLSRASRGIKTTGDLFFLSNRVK